MRPLEQAEQPVNLLRVDGRPCKTFRSDEQYRAIESTEGMIPWNGRTDNLIDRFDGRALLDFYREPPPASARRPRTDDEIELDEVIGLGWTRVTATPTSNAVSSGLYDEASSRPITKSSSFCISDASDVEAVLGSSLALRLFGT